VVVEGKREALDVLHDGHRYIYIMHTAHGPCCVVRTDHVWSCLSV